MASSAIRCFEINVLVGEIEMYLCAPEINHFHQSIRSKKPMLDIDILAKTQTLEWIENGVRFADIPEMDEHILVLQSIIACII